MRTVYGPNPISTPSSDVEMDVDAPEAGEVAFTLVTNKKGGKGKAKASQAAKANISGPKFAPASSHEDFLRLLQLKEAFPNLSQATIISMHQASLGVARASQGSPSRPSVSRTFKMTTQGPTRHQVLIPLAPAAAW